MLNSPSGLEVGKVEIRECRKEDLELLEKHISTGKNKYHQKRFNDQTAGLATYLIAWLNGAPVGHLHLKWQGADEQQVRDFVGNCPELNAISVYPPELRSKGIGRKLIEEAESLAKTRGYQKVGLGVGMDNEKARELYERLGYGDSGLVTYTSSWEHIDADGKVKTISEKCNFLVKAL